MKKEITLGQLLSTAVVVMIALLTAWGTMNNRVTRQGEQIEAIKDRQNRIEMMLNRIDDKLETIIIKIENKKDR